MRVPRNLGSFATALACINLLIPLQTLSAADAAANGARTAPSTPAQSAAAAKLVARDVSLGTGNDLRGQLVDKNGAVVAKRIVVAVHADKSSLQTVSDSEGRFRFTNAKPGTYQVASERSYQLCRCWAAKTAPPSAAREVLLVEGDLTLRGQRPVGELLSGPVLIGLIIAAAIIIPIAVHNSQKTAS